jgi:DNA repair exonuclease SbcCD ATPase subunit
MDPKGRSEYDKILSLLHAMAERENQIELRFNRRMDRAEKRMDQAEKRMDQAEKRMDQAEKRMDRAEERMEKFDRRLEATRKLVEAGIKFVVRMEQRHHAEMEGIRESIRELNKSQKAFLDSLRKSGNGYRRSA